MGILPGLRYILLTPALIETMSREELEAVIAHEIGHVKKYHLLLYICLIAGFSLLAGMLGRAADLPDFIAGFRQQAGAGERYLGGYHVDRGRSPCRCCSSC